MAQCQSDATGVKITFKGLCDGESVVKERLHGAMATFQLDDVFTDGECAFPYTVQKRVDQIVLRGDKVVGDIMDIYKPREIYFNEAFFEGLGAARACAIKQLIFDKCMEERNRNFEEATQEECES